MALQLYELGGRDDLRYSLFSWRSRLALAHKGLAAEFRPVRVSDKAALAFSGQDKVPILVDAGVVVTDSWRIAEHLDAHHPGPSLFGGEVGRGLARFVNLWVDRQILPKLVPCRMVDVLRHVDEADGRHLRGYAEAGFGKTIEEMAADRDADRAALRRLLDPARAVLRGQPFLSGTEPAYADYILFSGFQWARLVSEHDPLEPADTLAPWRERMLDLFDGLARRGPPFVGIEPVR